MKRRAALSEFSTAAMMLGLAGLALETRFTNRSFNPSARTTSPHIIPSKAELARDMRDLTAKANASFDFATGTHLLPHIQLVQQATGMPMLALMSLACFESEMGLDLRKSQKVKADKKYGKETASGVVQILDDVYLYLVEKHLIKHPSQTLLGMIKLHGGNLGGQLLGALATIKTDAKKIEAKLSRRSAFSLMFGHKKPDMPHAGPKMSIEMVNVLQENPGMKARILATRDDDLISMSLVAADLMQTHAYIDPSMNAQLGGTSFRMLHMFGLDGTLNLLDAYQNNPATNMATIFGLADVPSDDLRWRILDANGIPGDTRADDYVNRAVYDYGIVSAQLAARYAAYEKTQALVAASNPLAKSVPVSVPEKHAHKATAKPKTPVSHHNHKFHKKPHKLEH